MTEKSRRIVLGAAGGALLAVCWWPFGLAPLLPLAFFLLIRGLRRVETGRQAVGYAVVYSAAEWAVGAHFLLVLIRYSPLAVAFYALAVAYILPFAIAVMWGAWRLEHLARAPRILSFICLYPIVEWARSLGDFSFPADVMGNAFGYTPQWLAWTPWTGPFGISALAASVGALLDAAWERRARHRAALGWLVAAVALWFAPVVTDLADAPARGAGGPTIRVGIVQPALTIQEKFDRSNYSRVWSKLEELTRRAAPGADLVLWPESARLRAITWDAAGPFSDSTMETLAREVGVPILYGCEIARLRDGELEALYNGAAIVYPDGRPAQWYGKQQLLPFAERFPFGLAFGGGKKSGGRRSLLTMLGHFSRGPGPVAFEVGPARIGPLICYEGMYPRLSREHRQAGANVLALLTNDAWWGRSVFAAWHAQMVSAPARSVGAPVVRAANNGISSLTDRRGRMLAATKLDEITTLAVEVAPTTDRPTFYARTGEWLIGLLAALLVANALVPLLRRGRS